MSHGDGKFGKDKIVYGIDDTAKKLMESKKIHQKRIMKTFAH